MVNGIIGRKVGMTQVFGKDGTVEPATVIKAGPCVVLRAELGLLVVLGRLRDRAREPRARAPRRVHDLRRRLIEDAVVVRL
jgi:hypothetical protein